MAGPSGAAATGEGQLEEKVDLSAEANDKIEQANQLAPSNLEGALALLFAAEKKCRTQNDNASLIRVCEASVALCHDYASADVDVLLSTIQTLTTRRSQKAGAIKATVRKCLPWCIDEASCSPLEVPGGISSEQAKARNRLVEALRDVSDGKLFLERERAILTRVLATIKVGPSVRPLCSFVASGQTLFIVVILCTSVPRRD
jgi:26S proteasome regulatory subunit N5